jgi:23S rRNA pseudouridine1911/1915/1917 synthase
MRNLSIEILYEDNHIIAVNKHGSDLSQGDKTGDESIDDKIKEYLRVKHSKPGDAFLGVVHRLDRPVSGVVLYGKTTKALSRLGEMFRNKEVKKTYWAIVKELPPSEEAELRNWLKKNEQQNKSYAFPNKVKDSKEAVLNYKLISRSDNHYLLEVNLLTGRHHQIRCQLAHIGCPIRGDLKYGFNRSNEYGSIDLHARKIEFVHPVTREPVTIVAPVPEGGFTLMFSQISKEGISKIKPGRETRSRIKSDNSASAENQIDRPVPARRLEKGGYKGKMSSDSRDTGEKGGYKGKKSSDSRDTREKGGYKGKKSSDSRDTGEKGGYKGKKSSDSRDTGEKGGYKGKKSSDSRDTREKREYKGKKSTESRNTGEKREYKGKKSSDSRVSGDKSVYIKPGGRRIEKETIGKVVKDRRKIADTTEGIEESKISKTGRDGDTGKRDVVFKGLRPGYRESRKPNSAGKRKVGNKTSGSSEGRRAAPGSKGGRSIRGKSATDGVKRKEPRHSGRAPGKK